MKSVPIINGRFRAPATGLALIITCILVGTQAGIHAEVAGIEDLAGPLRQLAGADSVEGETDAITQMERGFVQTQVLLQTASTTAVGKLEQYGAVVEYRHGRRLQCGIPIDSLMAVAGLPQVSSVRRPRTAVPCQGIGVVSEGVQLTNASALQNSGTTGVGTRIAIIDLGFREIQEAEVRNVTTTISLRSDRRINASRHGTAMAETVADMAPEAGLTLIAVDTPLSIEAAVDYVATRTFDVAVMGLVLLEGPFDGTHPLTEAVQSAAETDLLWVQAAGNMARRHRSGIFTDTDNDGIHEFEAGMENMGFDITGGNFEAYLSWFETASVTTAQDYDLVLVDGSGNVVAQSAITQNGDDPPREYLNADVTAGTYSLQIHLINGDPDAGDRFQLFIPRYDISSESLQVPEGSLGIPAEAPTVCTVGAVRGVPDETTAYDLPSIAVDTIEPFSSRGPTVSGDRKPDLVAPDGCRTGLVGGGETPISAGGDFISPRAFGTSFSAAHVAGAAALLFSEDDERTAADVRSALDDLSADVPPPPPPDPPLPNNIYGYGRLSLRVGVDIKRPVGRITYPASGQSISTTTPQISALVTDVGSGIDFDTIKMKVDDERLSDVTVDTNTGAITADVPHPLTRGSHVIALDVDDNRGNSAETVTSTFRVSPPTIDAGLHLISLPYTNFERIEPRHIFRLPSEKITVVRWLPTDSTPRAKYHFWGGEEHFTDPYASFEPLDARESPEVVEYPPAGLGYFVRLDEKATLEVPEAQVTDSLHNQYEVKLSVSETPPRGWNMIGCPFPNAVTWGNVEFVTDGVTEGLREAIEDGVTEGVLFSLQRSGGSYHYEFPANPMAGTLEPFKGYWIHVSEDTTLRMYNTVTTGTRRNSTEIERGSNSASEWALRFGAACAGGKDPANYVGISSSATDAYDAGLDVPAPPALSTPVNVSMIRDEWDTDATRFLKDVRGAIGTGQQWDFIVETQQPRTDVTVNWPQLNSTVPENITLILEDVDAGNRVFLRTTRGYTYSSGASEDGRRHLRIIAMPAEAPQALTVRQVNVQQISTKSVQLTYLLSRSAEVSARILNIAGREIRDLGTHTATADSVQSLTWSRRNAAGSVVPPGRYVVRLSARSRNGQATQAVRTFSVR